MFNLKGNQFSLFLIVLFFSSLFATVHAANESVENSADLIGIVMDKYDNLIINANLEYQCNIDSSDFPIQTNNFGAFKIKNIPFGKCRIFATIEDEVGYVDVEITEDKFYQTEININKKAYVRQNNVLDYFIIFIIILMILISVFIIFKKIKSKKKVNNQNSDYHTNHPNKIIVTQKMHDIMITLNDTEKSIIDFLIKEHGHSTLKNIRFHTNIPKTSLSRWAHVLEQKNIVKMNSIGNMKKVILTDFFYKK